MKHVHEIGAEEEEDRMQNERDVLGTTTARAATRSIDADQNCQVIVSRFNGTSVGRNIHDQHQN